MEEKKESRFMDVKEVMEELKVSQTTGYEFIRELNDELVKKGYMVVRGKVNRNYFYKRFDYKEEGDL